MNAAAEAMRQASVTRLSSWTERNRQWLVAAIDRLRRRLDGLKDGAGSGHGTPQDCVAAADPHGFTPALLHCASVFGLSTFERELLLLAAGLELDSGLRAIVAALNQGISARASFGLALAVLAEPHWDALSPSAALRYWRMVTPDPGSELTLAPLLIDERILHYVAGISATDAVLEGVVSAAETPPNPHPDDLPLIQRLARLTSGEHRRGAVIVLHSGEREHSTRRDLALVVAAQSARPALWMEAGDLPADPDGLLRLARHADREAALTGALPVLSFATERPDPAAFGLAARMRSALLWLGPDDSRLADLTVERRVLRVEVPAADTSRTSAALLDCWRAVAPPAAREDEAVAAALTRAGQQFHLGRAALDDIVEQAQVAAPAERPAAIWQAAREAVRGGIDAVAQRIDTRLTFEDLVLPTGQSAMLRDIAQQVRQRERVYREWGFGARHSLGQGLVALFAGESGTGKTLAAEAIANAVDLDLYRVDLATLVSKYIGETEKNLKRLFDAAEASGAVLLFDEADAIFGKRSEVKDSHDRYANIEIAYLLQRVETYRGLAVLTTNMKSALDRAFMRRIRFVVTFPFPDAAARAQIWRRQFPPEAPLGTVDFGALARLNLSGGHIRSIAVNAAFKAAGRNGQIDQATVLEAAREEFAKLEKNFSDAMIGGAP